MEIRTSLWQQYGAASRLLSVPLRLGAIVLLVGTVAAAGLEVLGLSLLAALLAVITPANSAALPSWVVKLVDMASPVIGTDVIRELIVLCGVTFAVKNIFMAGLAWVEATFAFGLQAHFAHEALERTLERDYSVVASRKPAEHINLLTADLVTLVFSVVLPSLTLFSEALLLGSIVIYLLLFEPAITIAIISVIGALAAVLVGVSRSTVSTWGRERQRLEDERMAQLREVFDHLREVYVYRAAAWAVSELNRSMQRLASTNRAFQMLSTGPRFVLEFALVSVLLTIVFIGTSNPGRHGLVVSMGLFAAAGFRLLIGTNRVIMAAQSVRFGQPAFTRVLDASTRVDQSDAPSLLPPPQRHQPASVLCLEAVAFGYMPAQPVLSGIDLCIERGKIVGIVGASGSGKTTLLELVAGLRRPSAGRILLDGSPLHDSRAELFRNVGYVGQSTAIFADTIRRNVAYGFRDAEIDDEAIWDALSKAHLSDLVNRAPGTLDFVLKDGGANISGGQAQRLALARAIYARCSFMLLDEPTSALDPATEADVIATLDVLARSCGILIVSHRVAPLQACSQVLELRDGRLHVAKSHGARALGVSA